MKHEDLAKTFYMRMVRDVPNMSAYAKTLFHPQNFAPFVPFLYRKINGCIQSYSLKFDEVDWDRLYTFLKEYAQVTDPIKDRQTPLVTLQDAQTDLISYLSVYFRDLQLRTEQMYRQYLQEQAGTWAYKATMPIAPKYPMAHPLNEATLGGKLLGQEEANKAMEDYYVNKNPYENALGQKARDTEAYMNNFFQNGGWDGQTDFAY